ncbi:hypothetical protein CAAU_0456 [Caloramator australicus RC3]|uniref:Uncharacterized protein n=1 Tax=Caloramator australicus RC3 TaxID=857293 RepID=G0V4R5_9CLOT|nr:hypothetical protein CAAU_0456 [Caloramator australicus RC3]
MVNIKIEIALIAILFKSSVFENLLMLVIIDVIISGKTSILIKLIYVCPIKLNTFSSFFRTIPEINPNVNAINDIREKDTFCFLQI